MCAVDCDMGESLWVAILSLLGTCLGSLGGIIAASKLTNFRLSQLEKKVEKHNNLVERMVKVEQISASNTDRIDDICERMK